MRSNKNKILKDSLRRVPGDQQLGVSSAEAVAPASWWRSVMQGLGSKRRRRALATMQRLVHHDVEDTISEADIQGWLSMLEAQSGSRKSISRGSDSHKPDTKAAPSSARPSRRR